MFPITVQVLLQGLSEPAVLRSEQSLCRALLLLFHLQVKNGLPGRLIPIPREITAGCGFAWKAAPEDETILIEALTKEGIEWASTHILEI